MFSQDGNANVFDVWNSAVTAMTEATLSLAKAATSASASLMQTSIGAPITAPAQPAARGPMSFASIFDPVREPAPAPAKVTELFPRSTAADAPQSWYKSPYRSPFDPMFWLEPHGTLAESPAWPWLMPEPATMTPWMQQATAFQQLLQPAAMMQQMMLPPAMFQAFKAPMLPPLAMLGGFGATSPFVIDWWKHMMSFQQGAMAATAIQSNPVLDSTFSAYRTAGGHAAAQIVTQAMTAPDPWKMTMGGKPWWLP